MKQSEIYDRITAQFLICQEKKAGHGEDSGISVIGDQSGVICVMDGCGGLGAITYPQTGDKTGAYIASRVVANSVLQWYRRQEDGAYFSEWNELKNVIDKGLAHCEEKAGAPALRLKGSMVRNFPTTIAAVAFEQNGEIRSTHIWAGDSRTYLLTEQGLAQVSIDDVQGEDALSNLTNDGILTNVISQNVPYSLHERTIALRGATVMLAATDGCFGYLHSPMEFEAMLLECLISADNVAQWQENLRKRMSEAAEDDFTLAVSAVDYADFEALRNAFLDRYAYVKKMAEVFISAPAQRKQSLWEAYKSGYCRYQRKG